MPGKRPSSSMRSWTTPSYTDALLLARRWQAGQAATYGAKATRHRAHRIRLLIGRFCLRIAYGRKDQISQGVDVAGVNGCGVDVDGDHVARARCGDLDQTAAGASLDSGIRELLLRGLELLLHGLRLLEQLLKVGLATGKHVDSSDGVRVEPTAGEAQR